jgi:phage terminase large subunit-like protein
VETLIVRHISGATSRITLKAYDQGRERWQGETLDFVWFDEEPPEAIYTEGITRTNATQGITWMTLHAPEGHEQCCEAVPGGQGARNACDQHDDSRRAALHPRAAAGNHQQVPSP